MLNSLKPHKNAVRYKSIMIPVLWVTNEFINLSKVTFLLVELDLKTSKIAFVYSRRLQSGVLLEILEFIMHLLFM